MACAASRRKSTTHLHRTYKAPRAWLLPTSPILSFLLLSPHGLLQPTAITLPSLTVSCGSHFLAFANSVSSVSIPLCPATSSPGVSYASFSAGIPSSERPWPWPQVLGGVSLLGPPVLTCVVFCGYLCTCISSSLDCEPPKGRSCLLHAYSSLTVFRGKTPSHTRLEKGGGAF